METNNCNTVVVKKGNVGVGSETKTSIVDYQKLLSEALTRRGTFMTFDAWRMSLGKNNGWGQKVFFQAMKNVGLLCVNPNNDKDNDSKLMFEIGKTKQMVKGQYIPCAEAQAKYPTLFIVKDYAFGFNLESLGELDEEILIDLRTQKDKLTAIYKAQTDINKIVNNSKAVAKKKLAELEKQIEEA